MDKYYENIKELIERKLVYEKKQEYNRNYYRLETYYNIGKELSEAENGKIKNKYAKGLVKEYSLKLSDKYGKFYSRRNLELMRQLYKTFPITKPLVSQLSWSHYVIVLPIKNENKRNYYINLTIENNFSKRQLIEYIKSNAYERLVNKDNIKLKYLGESEKENINILNMIKNPILITFNKSLDKITEKVIKEIMLEQIERTMLELGEGFAYVGSEKPIKIDNKVLRPDLIFFNYKLDCFVLLELKLNELTIKDIGQIEFYVSNYDRDIKKPNHNPTIGITISKKINKNVISYNKKENIKHTTYELVENKNVN